MKVLMIILSILAALILAGCDSAPTQPDGERLTDEEIYLLACDQIRGVEAANSVGYPDKFKFVGFSGLESFERTIVIDECGHAHEMISIEGVLIKYNFFWLNGEARHFSYRGELIAGALVYVSHTIERMD